MGEREGSWRAGCWRAFIVSWTPPAMTASFTPVKAPTSLDEDDDLFLVH